MPGLAERVARFAEDRKPRACALCEGGGAFGGLHDPACLLA
jgi:hypothetical protein